jgi:hypothetical protein
MGNVITFTIAFFAFVVAMGTVLAILIPITTHNWIHVVVRNNGKVYLKRARKNRYRPEVSQFKWQALQIDPWQFELDSNKANAYNMLLDWGIPLRIKTHTRDDGSHYVIIDLKEIPVKFD